MDLLAALLAARVDARHPDDPEELSAILADLSMGGALEERRAAIEALAAGYPGALRDGDEARAAAIAASLADRPMRDLALALWRAVIDAEGTGEMAASRWRRGALLAARAEVILVIAGQRSENAVETLAVALFRDGREISCWIDAPNEPYAALIKRLIPEATAVVGYDLPRLLTLLPAPIAAHLRSGPVADLTTSAEWLAARGRLEISGFGLEELTRAAGLPAGGEGIGARIDATKAVWFRLLRPRLLD